MSSFETDVDGSLGFGWSRELGSACRVTFLRDCLAQLGQHRRDFMPLFQWKTRFGVVRIVVWSQGVGGLGGWADDVAGATDGKLP